MDLDTKPLYNKCVLFDNRFCYFNAIPLVYFDWVYMSLSFIAIFGMGFDVPKYLL